MIWNSGCLEVISSAYNDNFELFSTLAALLLRQLCCWWANKALKCLSAWFNVFIYLLHLFIYFSVSLLSWKSQDSKFSPECAQLFPPQCCFVLLLSIYYSDSKPNSGSENENGFYVWSNNLNGFLSFSLQHSGSLWLFICLCLIIHQWTLRKEHGNRSCAFTIADQHSSPNCFSSFLYFSFIWFLHTGASGVKRTIICNRSECCRCRALGWNHIIIID